VPASRWRPQLPEWPPDIACPVEPKPPREVEDEEELVPVPVRAEVLLDVNPTEVEFGGRPEDVICVPRRLDELEYQCQPRDELDEPERRHGSCWTAGCAPGATATPCCAGGCWRHSLRGSM
jgi:hypothetical protein